MFIPDHALAFGRTAPAYCVRSRLKTRRYKQYLRGEVLPAGKVESGFWTVSCCGLPLGFVKHSDGQLKEPLPQGASSSFQVDGYGFEETL